MYFTGRIRNRPGSVRPSTTASTRGIPLPSACGSTRWTSHAASIVAVAQTSTTSTAPNTGLPCAQPTSTARPRLTISNRTRKDAAVSPVRTPTTAAATTNTTCAPIPSGAGFAGSDDSP